MHLKKKLKRSISWNGVPQKYEGCGVSVGTRKKNLICGGKERPHGIILRRPSHAGQKTPRTPVPTHT